MISLTLPVRVFWKLEMLVRRIVAVFVNRTKACGMNI